MTELEPAASDDVAQVAREFYWAIVLFVVGTLAVWGAVALGHRGTWATAPGLLPGIAGAIVAVLAVVEAVGRYGLIRGRLRPATRHLSGAVVRIAGDRRRAIALASIALVAVYYFVLVRVLPFELATVAYLLGAVRMGWRQAPWWKVAAAAVASTALVSAIFRLTGVGYYLPGS